MGLRRLDGILIRKRELPFLMLRIAIGDFELSEPSELVAHRQTVRVHVRDLIEPGYFVLFRREMPRAPGSEREANAARWARDKRL